MFWRERQRLPKAVDRPVAVPFRPPSVPQVIPELSINLDIVCLVDTMLSKLRDERESARGPVRCLLLFPALPGRSRLPLETALAARTQPR